MSDKLYVCLGDNAGDISLQNRFDVDAVIASAEEFDGNMPFSVIGTINPKSDDTPYLIVAKNGSALIYDVIETTSEENAKSIFTAKKRWVGKQISIKSVRNLSNLIKEYYS